VIIEDCKVATAYAIEALRMFDHLHFRSAMDEAAHGAANAVHETLTLKKPTAIGGTPAWFEQYYRPGSQREHDRKLFSA
jgi:hypothetical protein